MMKRRREKKLIEVKKNMSVKLAGRRNGFLKRNLENKEWNEIKERKKEIEGKKWMNKKERNRRKMNE